MPAPCLYPVSATEAIAWCKGERSDLDLILRAPLAPECVFIVDLPNLRAYRETLALAKAWKNAGAVCMICRTGTPAVLHHLRRLGALRTLREFTDPIKDRFFLPPKGFARWLGPLTHSGRPD